MKGMKKMKKHSQSALTGTKTEQYLKTAAQGEASAFTKYSLYSDIADEEGYQEISRTLSSIANNERQHAELWLGYLGQLGSTEENLETAIATETFESTTFYPEAAKAAKEEGFDEIAQKFSMTGSVEADHACTQEKFLESIRVVSIFKGDANTEWICLNSGYRTKGNTPPEHCPLCSYPKGYFAKI